MCEVSVVEARKHCKLIEKNLQKRPICFCVRFDAAPSDGSRSNNISNRKGFRGAQAFRTPADVVVPLGSSLESSTLRDLVADFMLRVLRRYPSLSKRTLDAFFINAEGTSVPAVRNTQQVRLLRLDVHVNAEDTLDNFFAPASTSGPTVYDVIAHWSPNAQPGAALEDGEGENEPGNNNNKEEEEDDDNACVDRLSEEVFPAPVIYPFTQRCPYTKLMPRDSRSGSTSSSVPTSKDAAGRAAAIASSMAEKEAARKVRRVLEVEERTSRKVITRDERSARNMIAEGEEEGRKQTLTVVRLMNADYVASCGVAPTAAYAVCRHYPVDTEPLVTYPSSAYKTELAERVEETAWLSHVFANTPTAGSALSAVKQQQQQRKKISKSAALSIQGNCTDLAETDGQRNGALDGECTPYEELIRHYVDVRRDLLLWERKTFRALTTEMRLILEKQKRLDGEIVRTAFLEELEKAGVLDFDSYVQHYDQHALIGERAETPDTEPSHIPDECEKRGGSDEGADGVTSLVFARPTKLPHDQRTLVDGDPAATGIAPTRAATPLTPKMPRERSPRSRLADDEHFRRALEESKARAKAALETISLIDMRWYEPISFKLAKHRVSLAESEERGAILEEEKKQWKKAVVHAREEGVELENNLLLAYSRLIEPVIQAEERDRAALDEQQERRMALLLSLFKHGRERLEMILPRLV
ncbi:hypothetical protein DQ04_01781070 [Trypanosoma grayi]|uniref:hypothetical protein n=1 Tax=Trypanosoma grayi TaxID=71804 RepID=UPI0004F4488F|nr:hypothetical protein DQ04_01781070 [Trypanosoma grayi]KEG12343.1 hypothetical protein DQ04_01781070 [Trypanosoma grayi]